MAAIKKLDHDGFWWWLGVSLACSHYLNKCWFVFHCTPRNTFRCNFVKKHKYFQSGKFISNCHLYAGNFSKPQCVTLCRKKSLQSDCTLCGKAHLLPVSLHSISVMRKRISCDSILMTPKWPVQIMKLSFSAVDIFRVGACGIRASSQYKDRLS